MSEQIYLDPSMAPPDNPTIRAAIHDWLDARDEQRRASLKTRSKHDAMIASMLEQKVDRHPYTDSITGKRRYVLADRTARAKVMNVPGQPKKKRSKRGGPRRDDDVEIVDPNADKVESRRVSRESVKNEIDPFASTRDGLLADAKKWDGGADVPERTLPKRGKRKGK